MSEATEDDNLKKNIWDDGSHGVQGEDLGVVRKIALK
jgi:hypothetical protein